jgi:hypothetical protein
VLFFEGGLRHTSFIGRVGVTWDCEVYFTEERTREVGIFLFALGC